MMAMPGMNMQQPFMAGMPTTGFMPDMNGMHNPGAARRGGGRFNNRRDLMIVELGTCVGVRLWAVCEDQR